MHEYLETFLLNVSVTLVPQLISCSMFDILTQAYFRGQAE
jgi:hypothetical protein